MGWKLSYSTAVHKQWTKEVFENQGLAVALVEWLPSEHAGYLWSVEGSSGPEELEDLDAVEEGSSPTLEKAKKAANKAIYSYLSTNEERRLKRISSVLDKSY